MANDRQTQANRRNTLASGIHADSQCIPGELPAELEALTRDYYDEYQPQGPTQRFLVDRLILCHWLRQRYHRIQAELLGQIAGDVERRANDDVLIGKAFLTSVNGSNDAVVKIFRQINANDRTYDRTLATLERLRSQVQDSKPETALPAGPQPPSKLASFPQISKPAGNPAPAPSEQSEPQKPQSFPDLARNMNQPPRTQGLPG